MKKISIIILVLLIAGISFIIFQNDKNLIEENRSNDSSNFISMMLENEKGEYEEKTDITFPKENYMFNPEASGCENGGTLSWNKEKEKIEASLVSSDKCYAYFDKYDFIKSCLFGYEENMACELIKNKDNSLIYHDGICDYEGEENCNLETGDLSFRYSGGNDVVNNYVCFGTNDKDTCLKEKDKYLYRIIGFFQNDNKYEAKLIKADYANGNLLGKGANNPGDVINYETDGSYYTYTAYGPKLNSKNNHEEQDAFSHRYRGSLEAVDRYRYQENGSQETQADWPNALLNTIHLNHNFLNSFDTNWQNKITNHKWKYKGNTWEEIAVGSKNSDKTIKTVYEHELGTSSDFTTYSAKIGLMYVTDYLYAASSNNWNKWPYNGIYTYKENGTDSENVPTGTYDGTDGTDYRNAIDENWMYMGLWEWTITQRTDASGVHAFDVLAPGTVYSDYVGTFATVVRPSFYLTSDAKISEGEGTQESPYRISFK